MIFSLLCECLELSLQAEIQIYVGRDMRLKLITLQLNGYPSLMRFIVIFSVSTCNLSLKIVNKQED